MQTFSYDTLDRLSSAVASGGTGGTYGSQSYTYNSTTGNLASKAGVNYTYGDTNHDHAVTAMGSNTYGYDANGNQTSRNIGGSAYTLTYDQENRLVSVTGAATATFYYDGDGNRVKGTIGGITTTYIGSYFEWTGSTSTMKKYYYAGTTRVAMRTGTSTINYLLGDHLGSTSITANSSGGKTAEKRYYPWGTERYTNGTTPTTFKYTGQREESGIGLYFYNARWYDPSLARFVSADSMVPGGVQGLDRYAYVRNNPLRYIDPSGHYEQKNGYTHDYDEYTPFNPINNIDSNSNKQTASTPVPFFQATLTPLSPQQQMTQFAIWESSPTQVVITPCPVPPPAKGMDTAEYLALLREITGEIDPVIPGPLTGTNISYMDAVYKAAEIINTSSPGNTYSKYLSTFAIIAPPVSTAYNFIYDKATNTGEYSNISITELTPSQIAYLITGMTIITPAIIINFIK